MTCRRSSFPLLACALSGCVVVDGNGTPFGGRGGSGTAEPGGAETDRVVGMTAAHNAVRSGVSAEPSLPGLVWSDELAAVAQAYADRLGASCDLTHSESPYGENLAFFGGQRATPAEVVQLWADEGACWHFGTFMDRDRCDSPCDTCGHYTQIVWRDTALVGCGVADCAGGGSHQEIWVCNYDPPGNFLGSAPY